MCVCYNNIIVLQYCLVDLSILPTRGPCSKYTITGEETFTGKLEFKLNQETFEVVYIS